MRVLFSVLFLAAILCGVGYTFYAKDAFAGGAKEKPGDETAPKMHFVQLDPLILPIINSNGVSQTISVVVTLELDNQDDYNHVSTVKPRITDAYIRDLYGALSRQAALQGGVVRVDMLKKRLNRVSAKLMGENVIDDVLLQVVHQRKV